jgi:hypothetical protein
MRAGGRWLLRRYVFIRNLVSIRHYARRGADVVCIVYGNSDQEYETYYW